MFSSANLNESKLEKKDPFSFEENLFFMHFSLNVKIGQCFLTTDLMSQLMIIEFFGKSHSLR